MRTLMNKQNRSSMLCLLLALVMLFAVLATGPQVAAQKPVCDGLECWDASDCGSKCFCNRPSGHCFEDSSID